MEDLTEKISGILNNPEMMNTIKSLSGLLDSSDEKVTQDNKCEKNDRDEETSNNNSLSLPSFSPEMMQMVLKLMPVLSSVKKDDKYTHFLKALRPLLSETKRKKLDNSAQLLQVMRILPILRNQGIL